MPIRVTAEFDVVRRSAQVTPSGEFEALPKEMRTQIADRMITGLGRDGVRLDCMNMDQGVLTVDHTDPDGVETVRARFEAICQQEEALVPQPGPVTRLVAALRERVAQKFGLR